MKAAQLVYVYKEECKVKAPKKYLWMAMEATGVTSSSWEYRYSWYV